MESFGASFGDAVDLVAIVCGEVDELNAKALLKSVIPHDAARRNLVAIWQTKAHGDWGSCHSGNVALDENAVGGQICNATVTAISVRFAAGPQPDPTLHPVTRSGTSTQSTHWGILLSHVRTKSQTIANKNTLIRYLLSTETVVSSDSD
jgi:hypothetical protein